MSVTITSELTKESLSIVEDKDELSSIYVDCFSDSQVSHVSPRHIVTWSHCHAYLSHVILLRGTEEQFHVVRGCTVSWLLRYCGKWYQVKLSSGIK